MRSAAALRTQPFDLLVIGGGITGCGIARDAALRGLRVALVEKDDFASGTSSRSSRLVHGGVRYLEHGHVRLVFEASAERRRLLRVAPHLVRPLEFTWPVYRGDRIPRWKLSAALTAYDVLALFRNVKRHKRLSRDEVLEREPALLHEGLVGGATYFDAHTNDARLTLANAIAAIEAGATVVNHVRSVDIVREHGRVAGSVVGDSLTGERMEVRASAVVTATGPWTERNTRGSKGAHIAVPRDRLGNRNALTLLAPKDERVFFALPAGQHAIIGTTDTYTSASPDDVCASNQDVAYLLDGANSFFPHARLSGNDVVSAWAGIRPLLASEGDAPGSASREHAVTVGEDGLISITGGKLTTYRVMARDAVETVIGRLGRGARVDLTKSATLPGGNFSSFDALVADIQRATNDAALANHLASTYGSRWPRVWSEINKPGSRAALDPSFPYTIGELVYCVEHEMAATLGDLLIRRTHLAFETHDHALSIAEQIASPVGRLLGWKADSMGAHLDDYAREIERIFRIESEPKGKEV